MKNIFIRIKRWLIPDRRAQVHNGCYSCNGYGRILVTSNENKIIEIDCYNCCKVFMEKIR